MTSPADLTLTRTIDAPRELLWRVWTEPVHFVRWFGPKSLAIPACDIDLRPGGTIRFCHRFPDGREQWVKGIYRDIVEPERLVVDFSFVDRSGAPAGHVMMPDWPLDGHLLTAVNLAVRGTGTELTIRQTVLPPEAAMTAAARRQMELAHAGWSETLDRLGGLVADLLATDGAEATPLNAGSGPSAPGDREMIVTRLLDAPRALVWKAWTDPAHLPRWWGPRGFATSVAEIDVREGGMWRFELIGPDGTAYKNRIAFHEIAAPERLVYLLDDDGVGEFGPFHVTVTFVEHAGRTLLTMRVVFDSPETRAAMVEFGAIEGGESSLDCLEEHLAAMAEGVNAFTLVRRFAAPRRFMFRMWAEPEHIGQWCRPKDFVIVAGAMDFRSGGAWSSHLRGPDGADHRVGGVYREIVPNARIVFTHAWLDAAGQPGHETVVTVTFEDHGTGTKLTFRQAEFATPCAREGHAGGWTETLDNLAAHVGAGAPAKARAPA